MGVGVLSLAEFARELGNTLLYDGLFLCQGGNLLFELLFLCLLAVPVFYNLEFLLNVLFFQQYA